MRKVVAVLMVLIGLLGTASRAAARQPTMDPAAVEAFVDAHFESALADTGNPGAVVAIVQNQQTLLVKGYGTADIETGQDVDPERTLYRLGSLTKPMTAIAILKLVEEGVLDLDEDVSAYLRGITLSTSYSEPITLRHLLTHQGGLDADLSFSVVGPPGVPPDMNDAAIQRRLYRVRRPGGVAAYDALGYGLLARILHDVTGLEFDQVVSERVFGPAGMGSAVIGLPSDRLSEFARCHLSTQPGDARTCEHAELSSIFRGSGSAAATAADMASFLNALLKQSSSADVPLLAPETFSRFVDFDAYRFHPAGRGLGLGIQEFEFAGRSAYGHGGAIQGFRTRMHLFPKYGLGIYYGVNGGPEQVYDARLSMLPRLLPAPVPAEVSRANSRLWEFTSRFVEEFLPEETPAADLPAGPAAVSLKEVAGFYLHNRYVSDNILMNLSRLSLSVEIARNGSGLSVNGNGPYEQITPGLFESSEGRTVGFRIDDSEVWASFDGDPLITYQRMAWFARPAFSLLPLLPALVLLLSATIYLLPGFAGARRRSAVLWAAGIVLFALGVACELEYGVLLREVEGAIVLPLLWCAGMSVAALAFIAAPVLAPAWRWDSDSRPAAGWMQKVHAALIGVAGLYVAAFSFYWGFLV